jgi:hypothetical protein
MDINTFYLNKINERKKINRDRNIVFRGFYTGCLDSGNLGDDILFKIFIEFLKKTIDKKYNVNCFLEESLLKWTFGKNWVSGCNIGVIGGGSLIHPEEISYTIGVLKNEKKLLAKFCFGTGISDTANFKIPEKNRNVLLSGKTKDVDFPVNDLMKINIDSISCCNIGGVRGPLDIKIAKFINKKFSKEFIYDPGILLSGLFSYKNNPDSKNIGINLAEVTGEGRIGIKNESYDDYRKRLVDSVFNLCIWILDRGYNIIFYSMGEGERGIHEELIGMINDIDKYKDIDILCKSFIYGEIGELAEFCSDLKFCIATRLHANILLNSFNIPSICLAYNIKSLNYMMSIESDDLIIPTNSKLNLKNLVNKFIKLEREYESKRDNLKKNIKRANTLYNNQFKKLIEMLNIKEPKKVWIYYNEINTIYGAYEIKIEI